MGTGLDPAASDTRHSAGWPPRVSPAGREGEADRDQSEAVRLFVDRARTALPSFDPAPAQRAAIDRICRRLDGIPLAIELAAARVRVLTVDQILARLDAALGLLTAGDRTVVPRHQTLRAAIAWSYDLLTGPEQQLWQQLAVFSGGWSIEAAEAVCRIRPPPGPPRPSPDGVTRDPAPAGADQSGHVLNLLAGLIEKSVVQAQPVGSTMRYALLETLRQFGAELLDTRGDAAAARHRHAAYYLALAERADAGLTAPDQIIWLDRLEADHDTPRAALGWAAEAGEAALDLGESLRHRDHLACQSPGSLGSPAL